MAAKSFSNNGKRKPARKAAPAAAKKSAAAASTRRPAKPAARVAPQPKIVKQPTAARATKPTKRTPAPQVIPAPIERMDSGLSKRDIEQFRELLLSKRAQLVRDVGTMQSEALSRNRREAAGDLSSMPIHMADLGTDNYEQEFTLGLIEGEQAVLREIDDALARIDAGTFGLCIATGKPIGKARLKVMPWAKYCYEHSLAQERGKARRF